MYKHEEANQQVEAMKKILKKMDVTSYEDNVIPLLIQFRNGVTFCKVSSRIHPKTFIRIKMLC